MIEFHSLHHLYVFEFKEALNQASEANLGEIIDDIVNLSICECE